MKNWCRKEEQAGRTNLGKIDRRLSLESFNSPGNVDVLAGFLDILTLCDLSED